MFSRSRNILLLLIIKTCCFTETSSKALPGCQERCGSVTIPYPFGLTPDCSAHDTYLITCNTNFNPPRPFISSINLEVLEISLEGTVRVNNPFLTYTCNDRKDRWVANFMNTPFTYSSTSTRFTGMGCDHVALIRGQTMVIGGCITLCGIFERGNPCYGIMCCQTQLPRYAAYINASTTSINSGNGNGCSYAFMVDVNWFGQLTNIHDVRDMASVPAVLDWKLYGNCIAFEGRSYLLDNRTVCGSNAFCSDQRVCSCLPGYQGNPYLPAGGCQDFDECVNSSTNDCEFHCKNTPGSYTCSCPDGYLVNGNLCIKLQENNKIKTILIGCFCGFGNLLLLFVAWWAYKTMKRKKNKTRKNVYFKRNGGLLLQQQVSSGNVDKTKLFTSKELEKATDYFNENRILGEGGQGTVYKGMLPDGQIVAIKKSKIEDDSKIQNFINEVVILSQIKHRNVVNLHGCCLETEVPLLIYEYIPNGTLYQYIHDENEYFPQTWEIRLRIATEIGGALAYLHSAAALPVYHRDIKSKNILLDEKYRAKVADFGTSRTITVDQTHLTTKVQGTYGYLDPAYFQSSQFTEKSDVYSFGVVLVELLTGQKPVVSFRNCETCSLAAYFLSTMEENRLYEIIDPRVKMECAKYQIMRFAELANRCLNLDGRKRPKMKQVVMELEIIRISNESRRIEECDVFEYSSREEAGIESVAISTSSSLDFHTPLH